MKKSILAFVLVCFLAPASLFAQEPKTVITKSEDNKTYTVVEELETDEGTIVTTTVYQKDSIITNGFWKNWTLSGALGTQLYYGDNDWKVASWKEMLTFPALDFQLTKWVSPNFGLGIGLNGLKFKGLYQGRTVETTNPHFITGTDYTLGDEEYDYQHLKYQNGYYGNAFVLAHADLGNILFGYKQDRLFDIDAYAGGGLIIGGGANDGYLSHGATFNLGLNNTLNITEKLRILLNVRGALVSDEFDGESYVDEGDLTHIKANHQYDGNFGITLGLQISLTKGPQWNYVSRVSQVKGSENVLAMKDAIAAAQQAAIADMAAKAAENDAVASEIANKLAQTQDAYKQLQAEEKAIEQQLADAQAANAQIQKEYVELSNTQYITEIPDLWIYVNFALDKWEITKREMVNLQSFAQIINNSPNTKFLVCGYADKQTASAEHNLMLSEKRVDAVYNMLVNDFGVDPEKLVVDFKGGVDTMFYNEPELSRCVVINTIKK